MNILEGAHINPQDWLNLVKDSPVATWFQTQEAYAFFDSLSFLEAFAIAVESEGQLKGLVTGYIQKDGGRIKSFLSRRAIILGGPLFAADISDEELTLLLSNLKDRVGKKVIFVETRNFNDYSPWRVTFEKCGFQYQPHYDIHVDTTSLDVVNEHLGKSRKRDIRVSFRDGASVVTNPSLSQVHEFYGILKDLYETKVKTPLFPVEFFECLYALDTSAFLLVEYDGKIVGGTMCVGLPNVALYEMYACGEDGVQKTIFPSEVATFAGLQYAAENGYPKFDMMGAGKPEDGGYGVRDFKLKFGGELLELGRYVHVCKPLLFQIGKMGVKIMKRL